MIWQSIETAPKDGTEIILAVDTVPVLVGHWHEFDELDEDDGDWFSLGDGEHLTDDMAPTHWMPLPPPPGDGAVVSYESKVTNWHGWLTLDDDNLPNDGEGFDIGDRVRVTVEKINE